MRVIPGFENYGVTKQGKIYSYRREIYLKRNNLNGYYSVVMSNDDGERISMRVHRIVALVYLPNPKNYPIVNHKDGNSLNNNVINLEWCSPSHNSRHAVENNLIKRFNRPVKALNMDGSLYKIYKNAGEAEKDTGTHVTNIRAVIRGARRTAGNYYWKYAEDSTDIPPIKTLNKRVAQLDKSTSEIINTFGSIKEASEKTGCDKTHISGVCRGERITTGGFKWKFVVDTDPLKERTEDWKIIEDFPNYKISPKGEVYNVNTNRILKQKINRGGYFCISLSDNKVRKQFLVHKLVAICYLEYSDEKPIINHKDGDKTNNCIENLEWCTYSENTKHAIRTGLRTFESKKLKTTDKEGNEEIYESVSQLAKELGVCKQSVYQAIWKGCKCGGFNVEYFE